MLLEPDAGALDRSLTRNQDSPVCNFHQRPVNLSFLQLPYQPLEMPLQGTDCHMSQWCACCLTDIPKEHKTLHIHLNSVHLMELLPGCPMTICNYFRSRWSDIKKHCQGQHNIDIDVCRGEGRVCLGPDTTEPFRRQAHLCLGAS